MFIEESKPIEVIVHYRKIGRSYIAYNDEKFKSVRLDLSTRGKYKIVKIKMKPLTWRLYNELQESAYITEEDGQKRFNYRLYKENRLKELIIEWDATTTNDKGESVPVPVTEDNIMKLSPDIAEAILEGYDSASLISEEDEKK